MGDHFGFAPAKLRSGKGKNKGVFDAVLPVANGLHERGSFGRVNSVRASAMRWLKRRRRLVAVFAVVASLFFSVGGYLTMHPDNSFWRRRLVLQAMRVPNLPPLYPEFRREEALLPQNSETHPFSGGRKYLWIASHTQWSGWGNFMQDMILNAHLTYVSGRSFVFDDFTWDRDGPEYAKWGDNLIPSRIPLSAIISGPIVGGPFFENDRTPLAISKSRWDQICKNPTVIRGEDVRAIHGEGANSLKILDTWKDYLAAIDDPCVEIARDSGSIFHVFSFGNKAEMLPIWASLNNSPILTLFGWSSLAHQGFDANRDLISPTPLIEPYAHTTSCPHCVDPYAPIPGLLAMHIRRGDFMEHCPNLCRWGAAFNAFNSFPAFLDPWEAPQGTEDDRMAVYLQRCLPTIQQIVAKVEAVRNSAAGQGLRNIYIMTNGKPEWLAQLKKALWRAHRWDRITTSRDATWTHEQKYVSQATDMLIGQRAQVVIGNGFSSMTSNIAMMRVARGLPANSTRMF